MSLFGFSGRGTPLALLFDAMGVMVAVCCTCHHDSNCGHITVWFSLEAKTFEFKTFRIMLHDKIK